MIRYAGVGLVLIAAVVLAGCGKSETETPKANPPVAEAPQPSVLPGDPMPAEAAAPPSEPAAKQEAPEAKTPAAEVQGAREKPSALGAIGKAVANTMGQGGQEPEADMPSEAPGYKVE